MNKNTNISAATYCDECSENYICETHSNDSNESGIELCIDNNIVIDDENDEGIV